MGLCGSRSVALRWERDWDGAPDDGHLALGPYSFGESQYRAVLTLAGAIAVGPGSALRTPLSGAPAVELGR